MVTPPAHSSRIDPVAAGRVLESIRHWPVSTAAAALIGTDGLIASAGNVDHVFRLASVSKPLTALAALVAVEEEAVSLEDPITATVAGLNAADVIPGATLRHLLAHASGVAPERLLRSYAPGVRRVYSNVGYDLIGEHVSTATGIPFASYLHDALAVPFGLRNTVLDGSPASGGRSTVADLARVLKELLSPTTLLHPTTLAGATSVQYPGLRGVLPGYGMQDPNDWGLGFDIKSTKKPHWTGERNSPETYGHFGQTGTMMWLDPRAGLGLVALADRPFGEWAVSAWPQLGDAILNLGT